MKVTKRIHAIIGTVFLAIIIGGLVAVKLGNDAKVAKRSQRFALSITDADIAVLKPYKGFTAPGCDQVPFSVVVLSIEVYGIDTAASTVKLNTNFLPCGDFVGSFDDSDSFLSNNISFQIDATTFSYSAGQIMTSKASTAYLSGDVNNYPLDTFGSSFSIRGFFGSQRAPLPVIASIQGQPQGFSLKFDAQSSQNLTSASVELDIHRTQPVVVFAMLIMILMWIMSLLCATLAYSVWFFKEDHKIELPYLIFTIALLFAMPTVRNAMPNAPPIGVLADQMVTGWAMLLLSLSTISHFVNLLYHLINNS
ncbi:hypothetical protein BC830DRAFT_1221313 [Chytriomyces sp. MP71]|nr:hypothetical protein BC830DRAFT_1221313 [Chytriomyces sp. MP71]